MIRYDTIRHVTSLAAKLACYACVLPGPAFMSIHPSVHLSISLCFCRACGRVSLSVPACACMRVCLCVRVCMVCSPCKSLCMHMYVCGYVRMYMFTYTYMDIYICMYVDLYRYSMPSQPARKQRKKDRHVIRYVLCMNMYRTVLLTHTTLYTAAYAPITINNNNRGLMMILTARIVRTLRYPASRPCSQHCSLSSL